ncbi:Beta-ketoacyl synthase [Parafrankia sp. EAN1pec]|uniref:type I polyketide synthase n=1 Tax=Parafrankia sp. (strain EAN1pec) TaxID=298653 RepID=UPI0000541602|nr:Beta-ketoacyl synthase [Frankia sp. EAN1pec]
MSSSFSAQPRPVAVEPGDRDLVVVVSPFGEPAPHLVAAVGHAGGLGILDLGLDPARGRESMAAAAAWSTAPFGVRVPEGCPIGSGDLPAGVDTVLLGVNAPWTVAEGAGRGRRVLVEVLSVADAMGALESGAAGLVARGSEAGGRVGDLTTFTLLQHLIAAKATRRDGTVAPVWAAGGIGPATAAAAIAGGAAGVVLDSQLALVREMELPTEIAAAVRAMDGSETALIEGHRVYVRPDLPVARLVGWPAGAGAPKDGDEPATDFRDTGGELASDGALTSAAPAATAPAATASTVGGERGPVALRLGGRDLREQLLPVGQDGALAADLADRYVSASAVVRAVRESVRTALDSAARHRPLAPGSPFAAARGLRYPVAQGPMTRVSDRARFARSVADAGGLPFLALALLDGAATRTLLTETAELLGDSPWGVGILGFAPPEVRAAQLEAVHEVRPPCALIAGGRPAQSAPLEAAGIDTFLHVPSPGLLDRFLTDGARKFVFEGRECGGHVGPRASFSLWEAQITRLLAFARAAGDEPGSLRDVHVLFAGGIHDATSAAMVAAAAAPLADRGARVGVLMGTAYLFTEEAVADGAIMPGFQEAAIGATRTVLLETSPGHATRCVESEFVHTFLRRREELTAAGVARKQMWAELESLNLGRLRIASRGVRREGGQLVEVGPREQATDGMFMIGQVAALRSDRTTIGRLHAEVTEQATALVAERAAERAGGPTGQVAALPAQRTAGSTDAADGDQAERAARSVAAVREAARSLDIAIVGMSAVFPRASDEKDYWANVVGGVDAITEVSPERWDANLYYDPESVVKDAGRRTPSKWGGFLPRIPFDALAYGIPPRSLRSIDPGQLLALEVAARAIRDAGYENRPFDRRRTSVVFGAESGSDLSTTYGFRSAHRAWVGELPAELEELLPELDEDSFPGMLANVIAGRVANRLDLGGLNFTVDAACASSLAALDAACKELSAGASDMVLCGGVDTHSSVHDFLLFASVHALSPGGRCRSFDSGADGTSLGEGVAVVVLKRLADAQRDGDRIRAVIRSVAGSSDGRALGLTAPRKAGQVIALERAYATAGISPSEVGMLEAHATGTVVGDRTELATLTEVFTEHGAAVGQCAVGSVKSQIGHTKCAAGLAGLVKVARAVETGVRPPTLHMDRPNPYWERESSPFYFDDQARPWIAPAGRRHAGLSAFGFGGTNFHVVVSAYDKAPEPAHGLDRWPAELFVIRGRDRAAALRRLDRLAELVRANEEAGRPYHLRDLARTAAEERGGPVRIAFVVDELDDLAAALDRAREPRSDSRLGVFVHAEDEAGAAGATAGAGTSAEGVGAGSVAFLFPGQGSQRPGMLADLFVAFPRLRALLELAPDVAATVFPPAAFSDTERTAQAAALTDTRAAQPALGMAGLAVHDILAGLKIRPDHVAGHSYGELVALCAAGAYDRADLVRLSRARADAILAAAGGDPGTMAAVSATADQIRDVLGAPAADGTVAGVALANQNAPRQTVISGPTADVDAAVGRLKDAGLSARRIPVACAFHSPVIAGAAQALAGELEATPVDDLTLPVWSNTTAAPYPRTPDGTRATLAGQVAAPVRFVEQIEAMYAAGVRVFVETGPGRVLSQLTAKILAGRPHRVVATDAPGEHGLRRLLLAVAELAAAGVEMDPSLLFAGRDTRTVPADGMPRRPGWLIDGAYVRTGQGGYLPGGLRPARRVPPVAPAVGTEPAMAETGGSGDTGRQDGPGAWRVLAPGPAVGGPVVGGPVVAGGSAGGTPVDGPQMMNGHANGHRDGWYPGPNGSGPALAAAGTSGEQVVDSRPAAPAPVASPADAAVLEFLRTGRDLVAAQRDVLLTYLGGTAAAPVEHGAGRWTPAATLPAPAAPAAVMPAAAPAVTAAPARPAVAASAPAMPAPVVAMPAAVEAGALVAAVPAAVVAGVSAAAGLSVEAVADAVVGVIADLTGYPVEMLEPDLDLEADLSIDSIKRTEILGELAGRVGLAGVGAGDVDESVVEELAAVKTVRGIVSWIVEHQSTDQAAGTAPAVLPVSAPLAAADGSAPAGGPSAGLSVEAVADAVVGVIADLTGYPVEMLEPDLDLEADLSIDSIKRTEILGELAGRVGLAGVGAGDVDESVVEELAAVKTVRGIVSWIVEHQSTDQAAGPAITAGDGTGHGVGPGAGGDAGWAGPGQVEVPEQSRAERRSADGAGGRGQSGGPWAGSAAVPASAVPATAAATAAARPPAPGTRNGGGVPSAAAAPATAVPVPAGVPVMSAPLGAPAGAPPRPASAPESWGVRSAPRGSTDPVFAERVPLRRFVVESTELAPLPSWDDIVAAGRAAVLDGARFAVVDGGLGIGLALSTLLEQAGAQVRIISANDAALGELVASGIAADGLFWAASAEGSAGPVGGLPAAFPALRAAALAGIRRLVAVTGLGGDLGRNGEIGDPGSGAGMAGLVRTLARELPDLLIRLVDVHPKAQPRRIAESLLAEMLDPAAPVVVGYRDGVRIAPELRMSDLVAVTAGPGSAAAGSPRAAAAPPGLDRSGVVLLTGGARGITARTALALAGATGCAVELVGRTPVPDAPEDEATAGALDAPALRRALIATGVRRPAEIEARIGRILAEREIRATLAALREVAASVRYHPIDVRDVTAVAGVVADVYARHGRLDGVVHGAGVLEDRLLRDKSPESFDRVFRTKVDGARALLDALRPDVGFVVLFGSVAGVFGNRGQVDYAAANDALDALAHTASARFAGRVVSVDWGPWGTDTAAGRGMVSAELSREYARRGIGLIDPGEGVAALLRELGEPVADAPTQVVYMCAGVGSFDG